LLQERRLEQFSSIVVAGLPEDIDGATTAAAEKATTILETARTGT